MPLHQLTGDLLELIGASCASPDLLSLLLVCKSMHDAASIVLEGRSYAVMALSSTSCPTWVERALVTRTYGDLSCSDNCCARYPRIPRYWPRLRQAANFIFTGPNFWPVAPRLQILNTLDLTHVGNLFDLRAFAELRTLRTLALRNCAELVSLRGLEHLATLWDCIVSGCTALTSLEGLDGVAEMRMLVLRDCPRLVLSGAIPQLARLDHFKISDCPLA